MDNNFKTIKTEIYNKCTLEITDLQTEQESKEYHAYRFSLSGKQIIYRNAKITPKKIGQFVTFWKRSTNGPIEPFNVDDRLDFYVITVRDGNNLGQFVFPKSILIKKGIISTPTKEGKRGFRVYPNWDIAKSKQAQQTQKWQSNYFYIINNSTDLNKALALYKNQ